MREKNRVNRRYRSIKAENDQNTNTQNGNFNSLERNSVICEICESGLSPLMDSAQSPNPNGLDDNSGWGYCTEEQLEEMLLKNLDCLYNEAIAKLVSLGYTDDVAVKAILRYGYCYGGMDVLTNILHNSSSYLSSRSGSCEREEEERSFADLRQLEEYSLAGMVCLLQQVKPHLSKGDAMWCLLMSDLHVGRASLMEIPVIPHQVGNGTVAAGVAVSNVEGVGTSPVGVGVVPAMCRFHGGWGFGNGGANEFPVNNGFFSYALESSLQREIECPKRFNLSPSMKTLLKRNVAAFAAGFRANSKYLQNQSQVCPSSSPGGDPSGGSVSGFDSGLGKSDESQNLKNQEVVSAVLSKFRNLNLDEKSGQGQGQGQLDQKDEMILSLIHQIKDLEKQVKERKDWAHQKAVQAARKLSSDLTELKMLRMEREETQRLKKGKQALEDTTMKRLTDMETALRKASGQVDRANLAVKKLETENAEIRAEMEACKLSASESATTCLEVVKREKKFLKKLGTWEKQKIKLEEDIAAERLKISDLQQQLVEVEAAQKEAEAKWRQEYTAKEQALAQVEEERRLKEAAEATNKRKLEALRLRIEIDFQRHKDDLQRLEQDLSRLKASAQTIELPKGDISRMLHNFRLEDSSEKDVSGDRECLICMKDEASVVFLPCAHQVLCANCNDNYGKKGRATCPCCWVPIGQRIRVFGATS